MDIFGAGIMREIQTQDHDRLTLRPVMSWDRISAEQLRVAIMTSSMTAFTRQQSEQEWGSLTWEIRSVNHRYLETSIRLPDIFRGPENQVRERVRKAVSRGKIECQLRYTAQEISGSTITLNEELVQQLMEASVRIQQSWVKRAHRAAWIFCDGPVSLPNKRLIMRCSKRPPLACSVGIGRSGRNTRAGRA